MPSTAAGRSGELPERVWRALVCPSCGGPVVRAAEGASCPQCATDYPLASSGALDLRPRGSKRVAVELELGRPLPSEARLVRDRLPARGAPEVDFSGFRTPHHLTPELLSHFPQARAEGSLMLDLGCGSTLHREVCEHAGFEYVGLDHDDDRATILGDAHTLPFADESFGFVLSIAVLEHLRYPLVAMREVTRVLRPGARLVGTVAFLEPFHSSSYYHCSHLGTLSTLAAAGLEVEAIAPSPGWPALRALAAMGLFPLMPRWLSLALVAPLQALHRLWWIAGRRVTSRATESLRVRSTAGSFAFVATRPSSAGLAEQREPCRDEVGSRHETDRLRRRRCPA